MSKLNINSWQDVQNEVLARINARIWKQGDFIPSEAELAQEFGCARATVNRGLQALAETGLLERRRKAGTRVARHPVRKATLSIPILQHEIEAHGYAYSYSLIEKSLILPPENIALQMGIDSSAQLLHVKALHSGDKKPYVFEERWINPVAVPEALGADFERQSPNKWLVENAPFVSGKIDFSAQKADQDLAKILACQQGDALFVLTRSTRTGLHAITHAVLSFAPGHKMKSTI